MNADAIQRIEQLAAAGSLAEVDVPAAVVPGGSTVESLERLMNNPSRMQQRFKTTRISDFVDYVQANHTATTTAYVSPDGSGAKALIDHGTEDAPEWGDHKATLSLEKAPAFAAVERAASGRTLDQQDVIDLLEDWGPGGSLAPMRDGEDMDLAKALSAIRKVTISAKHESTHEHNDFAQSRSAMDQIEAQGRDVPMPGQLKLNSPVYVGMQTRTVIVRVSLMTSGEKPGFRLRILREQELLEDVSHELVERLQNSLEDHCRQVLVGDVER